MNASNSRSLALRKPRPKRKVKVVKRLQVRRRIVAQSAKRRKEQPVIATVRAACVKRDGVCRIAGRMGACKGASMWCHMEGKRRSQTRRMAPQDRHSAAWTLMLCAEHAEREERHEIKTQYLSPEGADGPMAFANAGGVLIETRAPGLFERFEARVFTA